MNRHAVIFFGILIFNANLTREAGAKINLSNTIKTPETLSIVEVNPQIIYLFYSEYHDEFLINQYSTSPSEIDKFNFDEVKNKNLISKSITINLNINEFGKSKCKKNSKFSNDRKNLLIYKSACDYISKHQFEVKFDENGRAIKYNYLFSFKKILHYDLSDNNLLKIRPIKILGSIDDDDYPPEAIRFEESGVSIANIGIDRDGSVRKCVSLGAGRILDLETCRLIMLRFRYTPAKDGGGTAVAVYLTQAVRWTLPD